MEKVSNRIYKTIAAVLVAIIVALCGTTSNAANEHLDLSVVCDTDLTTIKKAGDEIVLHFRLNELSNLPAFGGVGMDMKYDTNLFDATLEREGQNRLDEVDIESGKSIETFVAGEVLLGNIFKITLTLKQDVENLDTNISFTKIRYGSLNDYYEDNYDDIVYPLSNDPTKIKYGDISKDGVIDSLDAIMALMMSTNIMPGTAEQRKIADVSGEREITSLDAMLILLRSVMPNFVFPVEKL